MEDLKVNITKYAGRRYFTAYWNDPLTGRRQYKSTKKGSRRDAERFAAVLESDLRSGRYKPMSQISWSEFRQRYEDDVLTSLAVRTDRVVCTVFNTIERTLNPQRLVELTAERLSHYQTELRKGEPDGAGNRTPRSEATIRTYLAHLKAALKWAVDMGMLASVPAIKMPKRAKHSKVMKGRPITTEEFERMLAKVESIVGPLAAPSWRWFLRGLWLSGLRLGEALELYWDRHDKLRVDLDGPEPLFHIPADLNKSGVDQLTAMAPDLADECLSVVPIDQRTGPVFAPLNQKGDRVTRDVDWVSRLICRIGKAAGVKVHDGDRIKYASAHDLRRSFGERWARAVMPVVLQELMRHESIDTTLRYYVGHNAARTGAAVRAAYRGMHTSMHTGESEPQPACRQTAQTLD